MQCRAGSEIVSQNHTHIHPPERVRLHHHLAGAQHRCHVARPVTVTAPRDYPGDALGRVSVPQKHHIDPLAPEYPGGASGHALSAGAVQDFDRHPTLYGRNRIGMGGNPLARAAEQESAHDCKQDDPRA